MLMLLGIMIHTYIRHLSGKIIRKQKIRMAYLPHTRDHSTETAVITKSKQLQKCGHCGRVLVMESLDNLNKHNLQLKDKLSHLDEELNARGRILSRLIEERNKLLQGISQEAVQFSPDDTLPHYKYILPLVKEVHVLELKLKEEQREYENRKLQCEAARLGHAVLVDSFREDECVLKRWSKELSELSSKAESSVEEVTPSAGRITNITYHALVDQELLTENLAFTVLCQGVHVRLQVKSEIECTIIHLPLSPASVKIGVNSDTYIPKLEDTVIDAVVQGHHISGIVSLISQYIQDEMAPYVIIIPMKKKVEKRETKSKILKIPHSKPNQSVHNLDHEMIQ